MSCYRLLLLLLLLLLFLLFLLLILLLLLLHRLPLPLLLISRKNDAAASNFCRLEAFDDLYNRLSTSIKRSKADEFINRRSKFLTLRPVSKLRREKAALYVSLSVRSVGSYPRNPLSVSPSVCLSCPSVYPSIGQCLRYHYIGIKIIRCRL